MNQDNKLVFIDLATVYIQTAQHSTLSQFTTITILNHCAAIGN